MTDDPWAEPSAAERIALARSILGHANPTEAATRTAIDRALLALQGATLDEVRQLTVPTTEGTN